MLTGNALEMNGQKGHRRDLWFYALAALGGVGTGFADVMINDLLFTALLVLASCMVLGLLLTALAVALGGGGWRFHSAD